MAVGRISTYTDLQNAVADYMVRSDLTTQIPLFVQFAENEFDRTIRHRFMEIRETTSTVGGEPYYALPCDFLQARNVVLQTEPRQPLAYKTPQQLEQLTPSSAVGRPVYYTIFGQELRLQPTPDGVYTLELFYYQRIPPLADQGSGSNWLLDQYPDLYLYGALLQSQPFQIDADQLGVWSQLYAKIIGSLAEESNKERWNASPLTPNTDVFNP